MTLHPITKTMIDELQKKMTDVCADLVANNASAIAKELSENPEGKLKVSMGVNLKLVGSRIYFEGGLAYSRKFEDSVDAMCEFNDPKQPLLEAIANSGTTMTMVTGGKEVTITSEQASKALNRINKKLQK